MTQFGYALIGLTVMVAMVVGAVTFAVLRLMAGARDTHRQLRQGGGTETALLSAALQDAVGKLKAQERAMTARAVASDQLRGQIADSLTAGLLVVGGDGRIQILNPAGRRLLGIDSACEGTSYLEALASAQPLASVLTECLENGTPIVRRSLAMPHNINAAYVGVTVSPLTEEGKRCGAICLFADLTNVVELEEQLRLKETLARLGELTAGIAHEFRNGLATIHGYSRLIDPDSVPPQYRPYVQGIRQEAEVLGQVVTNFLNFARPQQLSFAPVELGHIVRRAADDLRRELPAGTTIQITGNFAEIDGDEVLLRQALSNLIRNAAEACDAGGITPAIAIEGQLDPVHRICRIVVEDNGPGIPVADREKVFRPFFTSRSRGTGLGLAIVQKVVVTHNGRVSVGTARAGGASLELTFHLPAA